MKVIIKDISKIFSGHRIMVVMILCFFGITMIWSSLPSRRKKPKVEDNHIYLVHSDQLKYDMYGPNPDAQIVQGHVHFLHKGAHLWCDSAYYYKESNTVKAYGHVRMKQGDTLSLNCDYASYDGAEQMMEARRNVVLRHRRQTLYTDSLDYDRLYDNAYFREGGVLVDGKDKLISDWGEYNTKTRKAVFYFNVNLKSPDRLVKTDTLYYDTNLSVAHVKGPSRITTKDNVINTKSAYFDTKNNKSELFERSVIEDQDKKITGDSLYYDDRSGKAKGYGNVVYIDKKNHSSIVCDEFHYDEKTGAGFATKRVVVKEFSKKDTLYAHADSLKMYTYHINTDSVYRMLHCYHRVRAYRSDLQAICDSMVMNSKDSCISLYEDPIVWSENRQLLGERINIFMNDSTVRKSEVLGQALSVELMPDSVHYNQVSSKNMYAYFVNGNLRRAEAVGNVCSVYYPVDDKDSSVIGLNYNETDTMRMYLSEDQRIEKIWMPKVKGTLYPLSQVPPSKEKLPNFEWFDEQRPKNKNDIFVWKGKGKDNTLQIIKRQEAPLQKLPKRKENNEIFHKKETEGVSS